MAVVGVVSESSTRRALVRRVEAAFGGIVKSRAARRRWRPAVGDEVDGRVFQYIDWSRGRFLNDGNWRAGSENLQCHE